MGSYDNPECFDLNGVPLVTPGWTVDRLSPPEPVMAFDPKHPERGWYPSEPLPLYCEHPRPIRFVRRLLRGRCCDGV